jgi:MFS family permease
VARVPSVVLGSRAGRRATVLPGGAMTGEERPALTTRSPGLVLTVLLVAQIMATMDGSIVAVAANTVRADLHTSDAALQFVFTGYTMAFAVIIVTGAKLGRELGYRRIFRLGIVGFTASSLICATAPNVGTLITGRALEGVFGALMVPQVLSLIQLVFTGPARARAIGLYSMVLALGVAVGQILGGLVVGADLWHVNWRGAFYINLPIGLFLLAFSRNTLPGGNDAKRFKPDVTGMTVLALSMVAVVMPLVLGRQQRWPVWSLICLPLGLLGIAGFFIYELRLSRTGGQPLLEVEGLRPRGVRSGLLAACILNFGFAGIVFPLTLHLQGDLAYTPLRAGLAFVPMPIGFATVSLTWTKLPERVHSVLPMVGLIVFAAAVGGLALVSQTGGGYPLLAVCLLFAGAGMALGFSTIVEQTAAAVGPKYASALSAMVSTGTLLASVFAVAIIGGIYFSASGSSAARGGHGLAVAFGANALILLIGVALAARVWQVAKKSAVPEDDAAQVAADAEPSTA